MRNLFVLTAAAAVLFGAAVAGRLNESPLQTAALDWERGDYISALDTYLRVLDSSTSPADLDAIALQTGELYRTTELTTDGALPRFSPDGRTLLYESGLGLARLTRLLSGERIDGGGYGASRVRRGLLARRDENRVPRGARDTGAHERGGGNRAGTVSGSRPASGRVQRARRGGGKDCRPQPRTPDANRKCHCPGSARPSWRMERGGVWFSGKGPGDEARSDLRSAGRRARRAKDIRAPGPADRAHECDRDGVAVRAARRRKRRASARRSTHLHDHRDRERTSHDDERLCPGVLGRWRHVDVRQPQRGRIPPDGCSDRRARHARSFAPAPNRSMPRR